MMGNCRFGMKSAIGLGLGLVKRAIFGGPKASSKAINGLCREFCCNRVELP